MSVLPVYIKRGARASLPNLANGEIAYCVDTKEVFIGNSGNRDFFEGVRSREFNVALPASGWNGGTLTQSVAYPQGLTLSDRGLVLFRDQDMVTVSKAGIYKSAQDGAGITFTCKKLPAADVVAVIMKIG